MHGRIVGQTTQQITTDCTGTWASCNSLKLVSAIFLKLKIHQV